MRILRSHTAQYGIGYVGSVGSRMLRDLLLVGILGPAKFGLWAALSVVRQYSAYSDLGFTNGLGRLLPRSLREQTTSEARTLMGNAWLVSMIATILFAIGALVWARSRFASRELVVFWGTVTILLLMFGDKQQTYSTVVYASMRRVGESGLYLGLLGVSELLLCLALAPLFGLYGLYAALLLAMVITIAVMMIRQPLRARPRADRAVMRQLAIVSMVLMGYGLTNIALHNVDRLGIMLRRGAGAELGEYHIALILGLLVNHLPYVVLSVLIPQMYRCGSENPQELRRFVLLPTALTAVCGVAVGSIVWLLIPAVLGVFLPAVTVRRELLAPLIIAELAFTISMVGANLMVALDRGSRGLIVRLVTVTLAFVAVLAVLGAGGSLARVAWVMAVAQGAGAVILGIMAGRATRVGMARLAVVTIGPLVYGLAVLLAIGAVLGTAESLGVATIRSVACLLALGPLVLVPLGYAGYGPLAGARAREFLHWPGNT